MRTCLLDIAGHAGKGVLDLRVAVQPDVAFDPAPCFAPSKHVHEGGLASACSRVSPQLITLLVGLALLVNP